MEAHLAAGTEEHLVEGLNFKIGPSCSSVTSREEVRIFPSGGNSYSPVGVRLLVFHLAASNKWIDPSSIVLQFNVRNLAAADPLVPATNRLWPLSYNPLTLFQRMRILSNQNLLEDVNYLGRTAVTLSLLQTPERRIGEAGMGFGYDEAGGIRTSDLPEYIPAASSRKVLTQFSVSGLLNQSRWIPPFMSLTIELELADATQAFRTGALLSNNWMLEDTFLHASVYTIDSQLAEAYAQHMISGKTLNMSYKGIHTQYQNSPGQNSDFSILCARGFSMLATVFLTFVGTPAGAPDEAITALNNLYNPLQHNPLDPAFDKQQFTLTLGANKFPIWPISSQAEAWYRLRMATGTQYGTESFAITPQEFRSNRFMVAFDLEKCASGMGSNASFTGLSSRNSELLTVQCNNVGVTGVTAPTSSYLHELYDVVIEISMSGVTVLD